MFLAWIVLLLNFNLINGDDGSLDTKYIDLLPESEKRAFIEKIARRIIEEIDVKETGRESGEIPDKEINLHSEYVKKLLKEEAENLRRKTENVNDPTNTQNKTQSKSDPRGKGEEIVDLAKKESRENNSNRYIERTIKDRGEFIIDEEKVENKEKHKEPIDLTLRGGKNTTDEKRKRFAEDDLVTIEEYETESGDDNQKDIKVETVTFINYPEDKTSNVSIEIEIIGDKNQETTTLPREIPVHVEYDSENNKTDTKHTIAKETTNKVITTKKEESTLPFEIETDTTLAFEIENVNNFKTTAEIEFETTTEYDIKTTATRNVEISSTTREVTKTKFTTSTEAAITTETIEAEGTTTTLSETTYPKNVTMSTSEKAKAMIKLHTVSQNNEITTITSRRASQPDAESLKNNEQQVNTTFFKNTSDKNNEGRDGNHKNVIESTGNNNTKLVQRDRVLEKKSLHEVPFNSNNKGSELPTKEKFTVATFKGYNVEITPVKALENTSEINKTIKKDLTQNIHKVNTANTNETISSTVNFSEPTTLNSTTNRIVIPETNNETKNTHLDNLNSRTEYVTGYDKFEIKNNITSEKAVISKTNNGTESTLSDDFKFRTEFITGYDQFETKDNMTTPEEIVQARTEFITGKYDSDISEEAKANNSKTGENSKAKNCIGNVNNKLPVGDNKIVNTTAIPMEPEDRDSIIHFITSTPHPILTTTTLDSPTLTFYKPVLQNDNNVVIKNGELENDNSKINSAKESKRHGLALLRGNNKEYRVFELLPGQQPFVKVKPPARIKLEPHEDHNLKDGNNKHKDHTIQTEQPDFAPFHNYAPENVYYNPVNRYGPNQQGYFIDGEGGKDSEENLYVLRDDKDEKQPLKTKNLEQFIVDTDDNIRNKQLDDFFNLKDGQREELREGCSDESSHPKPMQKFPNSGSAEHAYNAMLNDKPPKTQMEQVRKILHNRNYYGFYNLFKTTTPKVPTFSPRFPYLPPLKNPKPVTYKKPKVVSGKSNTTEKPEQKTLRNDHLGYFNSQPNKRAKKVPLIILTGSSPNKGSQLAKVVTDYFSKLNKNVDTNDASEELDPLVEYADSRKGIEMDRLASSDYPYYSDPGDISSGNVESMKTLNTEAIELVLNLTDTKNIYPILQKFNSVYNNASLRNGEDSSLELQPYVQVIQDMIRMGNKALENYDWLSTSVDIRSAIRKLLDLSYRLQTGYSYIHPKDLQLIKYMLYLHESVKASIEPYPTVPPKRQFRKSIRPMRTRPWLSRSSTRAQLDSFQKFWTGIEYLLDDIHDAIKHIAMISTYKQQHWFKNLKEIYLYETSRKQALEILLHLTTTNVISMTEESLENGLNDNYVKYAMSHGPEIEKTKEEMEFLVQVYNALKKEI